MPSKKKKYNARFPPARIKKIMQADEDVGKVAAAVPVIISRSLELFIDSLIERTATITRARNAKTLSTSHIKQAIHSEKTFDFLRDLVKTVPDHQVDDDGDGAVASGSGPQEKKPKPAKPRKPREEGARGRGRPRKVKPEPEVKKESSSDEDDEATESDEEQTSQEEMVVSDQASNSPAYNPVPTSAQQSYLPSNPLQSRLEPPPNSLGPLQNPDSFPQNTKVSPEQMSGAHFPQSPMAQSPFQPQQFPMHNYPYPQFVLPPGAPPFGMPPHYMHPGMNNQQHPPQVSHMPQGMMPFQPFVPRHMPFSGNSDGQAAGSKSSQTVPYMPPGHSESQPATTVSDQPHRPPVGQSNMTSHHDSNMPLDMSISGKSRQHSECPSQESCVADRPIHLPTVPVPQGYPALPTIPVPQGHPALPSVPVPVPQGYPALTHQGYSVRAHDQTQGIDLSDQSSNPVVSKQPSTQIDKQLHENQAISNYSSTQSRKGSNSESPMSQKNNNAADIPRDTTVVKPDSQEKDGGLVSFPGLSNIMKMNSVQSVINNDDDDDYDT